ncbi:MAG: nucleotidyltransferase family protein [Methanomicrobiales archaeon]
MKRRNELKTILRKAMPYLKEQFGISAIGIFGSYIRDEASPESDLDILVEFSRPIGWEIVELSDYLENLLEIKVDLVTKQSLHPIIRSRILEEVQYA